MAIMDLLPGYAVSALVAIGAPLAASIFLSEKRAMSWKTWGWGAAAFILSCVRFIPLYAWYFLSGLDFTQRENYLLQIWIFSFAAGAAEEPLRWAFARKVFNEKSQQKLRGKRDTSGVAMYGLGHGGIESIFVGCLMVLAVAQILALDAATSNPLLPPAQKEQVAIAIAELEMVPAWLPYISGIERMGAMLLHLSLAFWAERAVTLRKHRVVILQVMFHFAANLAAVLVFLDYGVLWSEATLFLFVACLLPVSVLAWRRTSPKHREPSQGDSQPAGVK